MRILFCHDGPLRKDDMNNYYGISHNNEMFQRYYNIADEIAVAIRVKEVTKEDGNNNLSKITLSPFEVIECPNLANLKGILINRRKVEKILYNQVKKSDFVVARLHSTIGFIAIDLARKLNKPYLVEVVACPWDAYWNYSNLGKLVAPFMSYATKKRVKNAPYVSYVTNEFLQNRYPTNGKSVNCSNVALKEFNDSIIEDRLRKIHGQSENNKLVIGTTGAVDVRFKGQQYIIKALGSMKKQGLDNFEYQLVGGGDPTYLKSVAEKYQVLDQVKFLGSMQHDKVFKWLDTIDLYTQPSRQEGLPRGLIEAMSRGLPAFGANTAGIPELLERKYIFSNTKENISEICFILKSINKKTMVRQATNNFTEAKKYEKKIIENRRINFFNKFTNNSVVKKEINDDK